jgi:hypothetical protein
MASVFIEGCIKVVVLEASRDKAHEKEKALGYEHRHVSASPRCLVAYVVGVQFPLASTGNHSIAYFDSPCKLQTGFSIPDGCCRRLSQPLGTHSRGSDVMKKDDALMERLATMPLQTMIPSPVHRDRNRSRSS